MIQGDGKKHEIWLKGNLMSLESSREYPYGYTTHCLEILEREKDKDELDALRTSFKHINARSQLMPCQKTLEKENKSMAVKIKKQPKEISLEELKQGEEYESVRIYIDEEKKEKIEKQYGVTFGFSEIIAVCQSEIEFKDNYMFLEMDYGYKNVPYEFIKKIEVVEK